jgi:hypothetical protein
MNHPAILRAAIVAAATLRLFAQSPWDGWAIGTMPTGSAPGGLFYVTADRQTLVQPQPQTPAMGYGVSCLAIDDAGGIYFGAGDRRLYRVLLAGTAVAQEVRLTATELFPYGRGSVVGVALRSGRLWWMGQLGDFGHVDPFHPDQTPVTLGDFRAGAGALGNPRTMATDGGELFVGTVVTGGDPANLWAIDVSRGTPTYRAVTLLPDLGVPRSIAELSFADDGSVVACTRGGYAFRVDRDTGAAVLLNPGNRMAVDGFAGGSLHPWQDVIGGANMPLAGPRLVQFLDLAANVWLAEQHDLAPSLPVVCTAIAERPFVRFGHACGGTTGAPRIGHRGRPLAGVAFQFALRGAEPSGLCWLVLGGNSTWPGVGALPLDAAPLGAPGCSLFVEPVAIVVTVADASGSTTVPAWIPAGWSGAPVHAQWLCATAANALGICASEALAVRPR